MPSSLAIGAALNTAQQFQAAGQSAVDMLCAVCGDCVENRDMCGNRAKLSAILDIVQDTQVLGEW